MEKYIIMGELSLDGIVRPIKGALPIAIEARKQGFKGCILPKENATEAAIVTNIDVIGVETRQDAIDFFKGTSSLRPTKLYTREIFTMSKMSLKWIYRMCKDRKISKELWK